MQLYLRNYDELYKRDRYTVNIVGKHCLDMMGILWPRVLAINGGRRYIDNTTFSIVKWHFEFLYIWLKWREWKCYLSKCCLVLTKNCSTLLTFMCGGSAVKWWLIAQLHKLFSLIIPLLQSNKMYFSNETSNTLDE